MRPVPDALMLAADSSFVDRLDLMPAPTILLCAEDPERDPEFGSNAQPLRVRAAVAHLCRGVFARGLHLVHRAEPAVTPIVLSEAARFARRSAAIVFHDQTDQTCPEPLLGLFDWRRGRLVRTAQGGDDLRRAMAAAPNLRAAVCIGGGVESLRQFAYVAPAVPRYPIGSTGSAADVLLRRSGVQNTRIDARVLGLDFSYPRVMQRIFDDLGL